jgi:hypothetical protein
MRSASVVAAVEGAKAIADGSRFPRTLVAAAQSRADEPGEVLGYYESKYGKPFPAWLKKGVADGAKKLYNEYSLLKYDGEGNSFRFADVIQLTHPSAATPKQSDLFKYALNSRYGNTEPFSSLDMLETRESLMATPVAERRSFLLSPAAPSMLKRAGMTWESLSGWLQGPMDAAAWEAIIPSMGYMALLRNLRNFDKAGISDDTIDYVTRKLQDPAEVAKSKQFPFRFLAAYQANQGSLTWSSALERALGHSLANVPALPGKTLILVDRSGSMFTAVGGAQDLTRADTAAIFGIALAKRAENATLVQYGEAWGAGVHSEEIKVTSRTSILPTLKKFRGMGGTDTVGAVRRHLTDHDRVVIITDEQYGYTDPAVAIPAKTPLYTWNLAGYRVGGKAGSEKRHTFGGLTDKAFQQIGLIEAGQNAVWPWEAKK